MEAVVVAEGVAMALALAQMAQMAHIVCTFDKETRGRDGGAGAGGGAVADGGGSDGGDGGGSVRRDWHADDSRGRPAAEAEFDSPLHASVLIAHFASFM